MREDVKIEVVTYPAFRPLRTAFSVGLQIGVISIGVFADSDAMQWCGFVVLALMVLSIGRTEAAKNKLLTISAARKRLDELEAEGRK